jgi:hypothetical protein
MVSFPVYWWPSAALTWSVTVPVQLAVLAGEFPLSRSRGRGADGRGCENPCEVARAHRRAAGQRLDRQVLARAIEDVSLEVAERLVLRELDGELRAELRLAAGAPEEHDELARDGEAGAFAVSLRGNRRDMAAGCRRPPRETMTMFPPFLPTSKRGR